jgi:phosphoglycerate dehydrogenase-like enzyme
VAFRRHEELGELLRRRRADLELRTREPREVSAPDMAWAEVLVGFQRPAAGWGGLRWIHSIGAGVDAFLFRTDLPGHVLVTRTSEDYGPQIGEYCLARALAETQHLRHFQVEQHSRRWSPREPEPLAGTRALIVGTGLVGRGIARALSAAGCLVDGLSRSGAPREPFGRTWPLPELGDAVRGKRWLVLAAPLTEATWRLLDRARLAVCDGAYLMNVARGALLDQAALLEALDRGWLSGAALDVFETEPLPSDSPLWERGDVTISPHVAGLTSPEAAVEGFLECLAAVEHGERPRWQVDRAVGY